MKAVLVKKYLLSRRPLILPRLHNLCVFIGEFSNQNLKKEIEKDAQLPVKYANIELFINVDDMNKKIGYFLEVKSRMEPQDAEIKRSLIIN